MLQPYFQFINSLFINTQWVERNFILLFRSLAVCFPAFWRVFWCWSFYSLWVLFLNMYAKNTSFYFAASSNFLSLHVCSWMVSEDFLVNFFWQNEHVNGCCLKCTYFTCSSRLYLVQICFCINGIRACTHSLLALSAWLPCGFLIGMDLYQNMRT